MESVTSGWVYFTLNSLAVIFVLSFGLLILTLVVFYIIDITQTKHAVRRNYPVVGRFRYLFEHMGEFFRQYFYALDREEMPFNRAERAWVYRAAKDVDRTLAFGSTRDLRPLGSIFFVNCAYPTRGEDAVAPSPITIGPYCEIPFTTTSILNISGMSYGALSKPALQALSRGAAKAGCWLNTGEGGLSSYHLEGGCDIVFQIGTAKFGVRDEQGRLSEERLAGVAAHPQVKMFEIKLSQGAKPGKGGILPGAKVTEEIALIRAISVGEDAISPNRHLEITNAGSLLDMIDQVRRVTGKPVGFKTVIGDTVWLEDLFKLILARGIESAPDFISVDGAEGGSGAAPQALMDYMGLPIRESLPAVVDLLHGYGLKERIKVIASGKLIVPSGVAWALCMGADFVNSGRGFMFSLGCIQAMQCNKNTCPTGVTTHDPKLQRGLNPILKSERVANYVANMTYDVGTIAHSCGVFEPRQLRRHHARMATSSGRSESLESLYPSEQMGARLFPPGNIDQ
ncbi:MAG: FMN-binding glutamate synthase family protein [Porticoccus sp.]|uniref:FMN-binding glutamate synthase family protein n=1 Tax=Porticoccus sp. TaxID=2024853 RepID=UPI000C4262D9|nr:FMN-binding glutamate synthase family protein [Porticoccus sp.]MAZ70304.1 FMN-binding glutamate synthase family protein [Porticoccus sp.]|tara:strand:+ start:18500 stop:20032 length:1533 start_codon:yes stop_codon:yes gene_type:complete